MSRGPITTYEVWQHAVTGQCWVVRFEPDGISGVCGPLALEDAAVDPNQLVFEEHPDDLEWIVRYSDHFRVLRR